MLCSTMDEEPLYLNLNPIFSIWPEPLLKDEYKLVDGNWVIEKGCHKRYIMPYHDKNSIEPYRIFSVFRTKGTAALK